MADRTSAGAAQQERAAALRGCQDVEVPVRVEVPGMQQVGHAGHGDGPACGQERRVGEPAGLASVAVPADGWERGRRRCRGATVITLPSPNAKPLTRSGMPSSSKSAAASATGLAWVIAGWSESSSFARAETSPAIEPESDRPVAIAISVVTDLRRDVIDGWAGG